MKNQHENSKAKPIKSFDFNFKVEVYLPEFEPLSTVNLLEVEKLSKGDHKVEIGFMKGGGCKNLVRAIVENGTVIGIEADPCEDLVEEFSEEILDLFAKTRDKLKEYDYWKPLPVDEFIVMMRQGSYPPRTGTGAGCFYICLWKYCLFCCKSTAKHNFPFCWIERRKPDVIM